MSGNGHGVIAFRSDDGIYASSYSVEGGLESAIRIGQADVVVGPVNENRPSVAMDAAGNAVAVWRAGTAVFSAARPLGGAWSSPTVLGEGQPPTILDRNLPVVAMDAAGNAIAAWVDGLSDAPSGTESQIWTSVRPVGAAWSAKRSVGARIHDQNPKLAVHRNGAGWLVFATASGQGNVPAALPFTLPAGPTGTPSPLTDISVLTQLDLGVAVDAAGNALVVWDDVDRGTVQARHVHPATGPVGTPRQLAADRPLPFGLETQLTVAGSDSGDAIVAWTNRGRLDAVLYQDGVWSDEDGVWSGVFHVDPRNDPSHAGDERELATRPVLAMTPAGDATLAYGRRRHSNAPRFMAARRFIRAEFDHAIRGSGWQPILDVERLGEDRDFERDEEVGLGASVAMEARGSALLVWQVQNASDRRFVDIFAWAPPIAAFTATPVGDRTVMFDASASRARTFGPETGSALRQYDWDFDGDRTIDRTERASAEATHTYPSGGNWNPRLRVTDLGLITAETSRSVDTGGDDGLQGWVQFGTAISSAGGVPALALDSAQQPVVAFVERDVTNVPRLRVRRFTGSDWADIGGVLNPAPALAASEPAIIIDSTGRPIVAWRQTEPDLGLVKVARFNGATWEVLCGRPQTCDLNLDFGVPARTPSLALAGNDQPAVAWIENGRVAVKRFDGGAWQQLSAGNPVSTGSDQRTRLAFARDGTAYLAWTTRAADDAEIAQVARADVTQWTVLGQLPLTANGRRIPDFGVGVPASGRPIVAWIQVDDANDPTTHAAQWDGTTWATLGEPQRISATTFEAFAFALSADDLPWVAVSHSLDAGSGVIEGRIELGFFTASAWNSQGAFLAELSSVVMVLPSAGRIDAPRFAWIQNGVVEAWRFTPPL